MFLDDIERLGAATCTARALLLDFDGPVCNVFGRISDATVKRVLMRQVLELGVQIPDLGRTTDPFEVLRFAYRTDPDVAFEVSNKLALLERRALVGMRPTTGVVDLIHEWRRRKGEVAIVSNNSATAISYFLKFHGLDECIAYVSARETGDVSLLKPDPHLVLKAIRVLGVANAEALLVGDSLSDFVAAEAASVPSVMYLSKPRKAEVFRREPVVATTTVATITQVILGQE